jgi:pre-mRNA-processing factor 6
MDRIQRSNQDYAPRTAFGHAPPGYVPGLGRGAVGFTTRSDIGPARPMEAGAVKAPPGFEEDQKANKATDFSEANYDEFSGYGENLFGGGTYDKEDEEADLVYMAIDQRMDSKRKKRREALLKEEMERYRKERPQIQEQFRDLKRKLGDLDSVEWESIPEPKDFSRQNALKKKKAREKYTAVPDYILAQQALAMHSQGKVASSTTSGYATPLAGVATPMSGLRTPSGFATPMSGLATPMGYATPMGMATPVAGGPTDYTQLGRARDKVLSLKLDRMADSVSGQTVVDPKGYLTDLNSVKVSSDAEVSDIKKARLLLKSVITTNPKHAPGWIAAARLEEETGKLAAARAVIMKGCEICPTSEDVWIESCRLSNHKNAKAVLAKAVQALPQSVKIWMQACKLEEDTDAKKAVLRRALELIPNSVHLWKAAVGMEEPDDARVMLSRAVELVPDSVEMWLALARLETYDNAKKVLNKALVAVPTDPSIWITAAKLEEANGNAENVDIIIQKAVRSLAAHQVIIDRDAWLSEAQLAEKSHSVTTCQAIVRATIGLGVDEQDRKNTWLNDAEHYLNDNSVETARAIFAHMLTVFPGKKDIWMQAAQLERQYGTRESLDQLLRKAVQYCPQAETLWLMAAKERWMADDVVGARTILNSAFAANPDSEKVWLAAVKLESENDEFDRARILLAKARERAGTARVWMKSAKLERALGSRDEEKKLLELALKKYPKDHKLWIMKAQLVEATGTDKATRDVYKKGIKQCPHSVEAALCYVDFELRVSKSFTKARSILETARLKIPQNSQLWLAAVKIEESAKNEDAAKQLMAKALQECPTAGALWAHAIATDPRPMRKARSYDALKRCTDDPYVFCAVAKLFWLDRKISKARNWFNRAVTVDPDLGDTWAWFYKFEEEQLVASKKEASSSAGKKLRSVVKRSNEADPLHGEFWTAVAKDIHKPKESMPTAGKLKLVAASLPTVV